jgi:ketosteroid isomerase-like protein
VDQPAAAPVDPRIYQDAAPRVAAVSKTTPEAERASAEAWERGVTQADLKALSPLLDPEGDFSFPGMLTATDRPGTLKALEDLLGAFTDRKLAPIRVWQVDPVVVLEWAMTGVQSGEWMGVKATQKPVTIHGLTVLFFDHNGLIADTHCYFDVGVVLAQLGAAPVKSIEVPTPLTPPGNVTPIVAQGNADEAKNVKLVTDSWDDLEARKEAGYLAPIADDIEVFRLDRAASERGKAARRAYFKWVTTGISSLQQTPSGKWGMGPYVIEEYTLEGNHAGRLTDVAPSGHALRLHYVDVDEMKDGKIVRTWTFGNSLELLAQTHQVERATPGNSSAVIK